MDHNDCNLYLSHLLTRNDRHLFSKSKIKYTDVNLTATRKALYDERFLQGIKKKETHQRMKTQVDRETTANDAC